MTATSDRQTQIEQIRTLPRRLEELVAGLTPEQLTAVAIEGEWSVAQNVHHLVDSHINSYVRCKLILTEENPTLRPYDEAAWARLPDGAEADISVSLALLGQLHMRWVRFWESVPEPAWSRTAFHPQGGSVTLEKQLQLYVEHGQAHLDQIERVLAALP